MVTRQTPARTRQARQAVDAYCRQTFTDKELVIVSERARGDLSLLTAYVRSLGRTDIRIHLEPSAPPLGQLRNVAVDQAAGSVVCQWDDDDLYHPQRLERQFAALESGSHEAVYLQEVMHFVPQRRAIHLTNWSATPARGHPGTLMARRTAALHYPETGPSARLGEDLELALALIERGGVAYLGGEPHLHLYVSHGANSWDEAHHAMLSRELSASRGLLQRREAALRAGLAPYGFAPGSVDVTGSNGIAFTL